MKKLNFLFTALLLLCCVGNAKAEEVTINGIAYDIITKAKQATVISGGWGDYSGDIVVPSEITYNNVTYSVTSIGFEAFGWRDGLTSITIPNSVTSIGDNAFICCSGLTSITIPNSVTSIGDWAFQSCSGLTSITIPKSVTSIGSGAFSSCSGLTSITIPNSVTSIGESAFGNCTGLTSVTVTDGNTVYDSRDNCNAIIETATNTLITGCKNTVIPNSVASIGYAAFSGCSALTSITIPNSVKSIGNYAFSGCSSLTSITIPNSVTWIAFRAFSNCSGLTSITIPNSVTSIGEYAFSDCSKLTSITIPNSVTSIGSSAFEGCSGLTSVTIGNSVTSIREYAFSNCENLADVYCLATNVPETSDHWGESYNPFEGSYPEYMTLHVPAASINNYKTTYPWSEFGTIVTLNGGTAVTPKCKKPVIKYNNGEIEIECETADAEFVTEVTSNDFNKFYSDKITFSATYNISVYATATGHDNSDTVNATLCWIECDCNENNNNNIINIPAKAVFVTSNNGTINISCALEGEVVELYTIDAMYIGSTTIENGCATIQSGLSKGDIAIIKIAEKSIKVILN